MASETPVIDSDGSPRYNYSGYVQQQNAATATPAATTTTTSQRIPDSAQIAMAKGTAAKAATAATTTTTSQRIPDSAQIAMAKGTAAKAATVIPTTGGPTDSEISLVLPEIYDFDPANGWVECAQGTQHSGNAIVEMGDGRFHVYFNGEDIGSTETLQSAKSAFQTYKSLKEPELSVYSFDSEEGWTTHASGFNLQNGYAKQSDGLYHIFVNGEEVGKEKELTDANNLFYEKLVESSENIQPEDPEEQVVTWYSGGGSGGSSSSSELAAMSFTSALSAASLAPKPVIAVDTDEIEGSKWNLSTLLETLEEIIKEIQEIRNTLEQYNVLSGPIAEEILEMYSKLLKELMNEVLTRFQSVDKFLLETVPSLYGEADTEMASSYKTVKPSTSTSTKTTAVSSSSSNTNTNSIKFYRIGN